MKIKSRKLKAGKIGNKVFSKAGIKTVKVPKGKKAAYQKLLSRAGLSKTAKVK